MIICLDPGHGGSDRSNKGPTSYIEADGTLDIALRCRDVLTRSGVQVFMTRDKDKTVPLYDRPKLAMDAGCDLFISIHTNAAVATARGCETFRTLTNEWRDTKHAEAASVLGKIVQEWVVKVTGLVDRGIKTRTVTTAGSPILGLDYYAVIRRFNGPAIILEAGFHSNRQDEALLKSPEFRDKIATALAKAILFYVGIVPVETVKTMETPKQLLVDQAYVLPNEKEITLQGIMADNTFYTPARTLLNAMGYTVNWTAERTYIENGGIVPTQPRIDISFPVALPLKLPSMEKLTNCHVITARPDQLQVNYIKGALAQDGINGGYFDGALIPLGLLIVSGKRLVDRVGWQPPRAVFAIRHNGQAEIMPAVDSVNALDTQVYKYALGAGPNLLLVPATTEGFQDDIMISNRPRSAVGITADGLVKLVASDSMSLGNLSKLMTSLGCVQAMNLDGGGSSQMRFGGKILRSGDGRKLATAILVS